MSIPGLAMVSPLARDLCIRRLLVEAGRAWRFFGDRPVIGYIDEASLRMHKRSWYRRSAIYAKLQLSDEDGGTRIRCQFSMRLLSRLFMAVWFGAALLISGVIFLRALAALLVDASGAPAGTWLGVTILPVMLAFYFGLVRFSQYMARNERLFLVEFLHRTVGARER